MRPSACAPPSPILSSPSLTRHKKNTRCPFFARVGAAPLCFPGLPGAGCGNYGPIVTLSGYATRFDGTCPASSPREGSPTVAGGPPVASESSLAGRRRLPCLDLAALAEPRPGLPMPGISSVTERPRGSTRKELDWSLSPRAPAGAPAQALRGAFFSSPLPSPLTRVACVQLAYGWVVESAATGVAASFSGGSASDPINPHPYRFSSRGNPLRSAYVADGCCGHSSAPDPRCPRFSANETQSARS